MSTTEQNATRDFGEFAELVGAARATILDQSTPMNQAKPSDRWLEHVPGAIEMEAAAYGTWGSISAGDGRAMLALAEQDGRTLADTIPEAPHVDLTMVVPFLGKHRIGLTPDEAEQTAAALIAAAEMAREFEANPAPTE